MKPIPDFPEYFEDEGNIYSMLPIQRGSKPSTKPRRLKPGKDTDGYRHVSLYKDGKRYTRKNSYLVLITHVGPRPEGMQVCHGDGNRSNDKLENLRWDTHKNNEADKKLHGTSNNGGAMIDSQYKGQLKC